jgi:hypothetical protein
MPRERQHLAMQAEDLRTEGQPLSKGYPRFLVNVADKGLTTPVSSLDTALTQLLILKGLTSLCVPRRIWVTRSGPRHSVTVAVTLRGDFYTGFREHGVHGDGWLAARLGSGSRLEGGMAAERPLLRKPAVGVPLKKK